MDVSPAELWQLIKDQMNRKGAYTDSLGIEIVEVGELKAEGTIVAVSVHANPLGTVHGGVLFTLMDAVGGAAGASAGRGCATVNCTVHFLRAAKPGDRLVCRAEVTKSGKHIMIVKTSVMDQDDTELAFGVFTYQRTMDITEYKVSDK